MNTKKLRELIIEKNILKSKYNEFRRNLRSDRKSRQNSKKNFSGGFKIKEIFSIVSFVKSRIFLIALAVALFIGVIYHYDLYTSIKLEKFPGDDSVAQKILRPGKFNTFVYYVETREEAGITYKYINSAALISIRDKKIDYLQINPYFQIDTDVNLVSYLNQTRKENGEFDIISVNKKLEEVFGLYSERYLVIDVDQFTTFIDQRNYNYFFELDYGEGYQNNFRIDTKDLFFTYFFDTKDLPVADITEGQEDFLLDFYGRRFGVIDKYRYMSSFKDLESMMYSNMSRSEFLTLINSLGSNKTVLKEDLSMDEGSLEKNILQPNRVVVDEKIQATLRDVNVIAEQAEIEVYNATTQSGLAYNRTRQFQNIGINVVKYGNYPVFEDRNILHIIEEGSIDRFENTIDFIRTIIGDENLEIIVGEYDENHTGDLILILGE